MRTWIQHLSVSVRVCLKEITVMCLVGWSASYHSVARSKQTTPWDDQFQAGLACSTWRWRSRWAPLHQALTLLALLGKRSIGQDQPKYIFCQKSSTDWMQSRNDLTKVSPLHGFALSRLMAVSGVGFARYSSSNSAILVPSLSSASLLRLPHPYRRVYLKLYRNEQ